ncbi:uncharacterized protein LOC121631371 isoform X2 [Melanotaenia boesemani]|uniref:uncharacterized protein LOC121631371 isoform X2 n=1 Tax=Melanotaenia boesemani TaxID=1250792 RepID=UPI001C0499B4|nr:uncharacterized protein LOC121631371 isoform X2 [Melanotaenia boesemani]
MPSFHFLDSLEAYMRTGKFPPNTAKSLKRVARAARKNFIYKDGSLWRTYRGRLLRVVRSDDEVREILTRYHDNNNHAGRMRAVKEILMMYYWVGVTDAVKNWIKACSVCQSRPQPPHQQPPVQFCLVYGCEASSYANPDLTFHRFPKDRELRRRWLALSQRDEGSLRVNSHVCSRHFDASCFTLTEEGHLMLSAEAVPTIIPDAMPGKEIPVPSDEAFLQSDTLEDLLSEAAAAAAKPTDLCDNSETTTELQEHQYCLPAPDPHFSGSMILRDDQRITIAEQSFITYNHISRYLSTRVLPLQSKAKKNALKRMAKRFALIDGVLMYTRVSPPLRVPRNKEEVKSILRQFHDNQGHYGEGICQRQIAKHFYWSSLSRDLAGWISSCNTCLNRTKRKWLRCSVYKCSNCCGPVERGLGFTFYKFPFHKPALLAVWIRAVGRLNWHPRLWSSICSAHFTEDCFDRSGEEVVLHKDAVPTLMVHSNSANPSSNPTPPPAGEGCEQAFFAKYDAVELYLNRRTYPPGLNYVEKNTFRTFCKKFAIKDGKLHMVRGDRERLVLRNRQQVEAALVDYHNELNHLDINKCLRLLNERYFWKTMRPDVVQWISSCSLCSMKRGKKPDKRAEAGRAEVMSEKDGDLHGACDDDGPGLECDGDTEEHQTTESVDTVPRIPVLLHLRSPIILQPKTPNAPVIARMWSIKGATSAQSDSSESQAGILIQAKPQSQESTQPVGQRETSSPEGSARTHHNIKVQSVSEALTEPRPQPEQSQPPVQNRVANSQKPTQVPSLHTKKQPVKRRRGLGEGPSEEGGSSCGLDPVVAPSTKPWPVFTIANAAPAQAAPSPTEVVRKSTRLQARTVVQQCSQARVKVRPPLNGVDAQWVEIQEGMVVYVCFFHGATEEVTYEMANSLMSVKIFRKDSRHLVSVLDFPGSVLFVPQDSLLGEALPSRRMRYKGGCELWRGAQLFSNLVSACRELMTGSAKCVQAGAKVEQGVYGQKQEIVLNSLEPTSLLLEF